MLVCHCFAVSDRAIRAAIESGAVSIDALARRCAAGSECGGCRPALLDLLDEHLAAAADRAGVLAR